MMRGEGAERMALGSLPALLLPRSRRHAYGGNDGTPTGYFGMFFSAV